jgi:hypothetical protein
MSQAPLAVDIAMGAVCVFGAACDAYLLCLLWQVIRDA